MEKQLAKMKSNIIACAKNPVWKEDRTMLLVWMLTGVLFAVIKFVIGKYNNYKIFEYSFRHAIEGVSLYAPSADYNDVNHYGIIFTLIIAPFSLLPEWLGLILWLSANTYLLYYAIQQLPLTHKQKVLVYWFTYIELMTAQGVQQFNISVAAFILLSFVFIEQKKDFWAAFIIVLGTLVKIYPIVGLAFFFFSKQKIKLIFSCLFWAAILLLLPILYTPGADYVASQYFIWFDSLQAKGVDNLFALSQNVSLLGIVRKLSGNPVYSDLWLIVPGLVLFFIPYLRISQYKYLRFRLMLLANVLLFVILFSSGTEASGYVIAMIGVAIWYVCSPSVHKKYNAWLFVVTLIVVALSTTELVPSFIRNEFIRPYVIKAWPCVLVWLTVCYEMCCLNFSKGLPIYSKIG
ncbi:MAG: glycosyltransferase family 87 protein [Tannerellaceae bacterium]